MVTQQQIPLAVNTSKQSVAGMEYAQNWFIEKTLSGKYPIVYRSCEGYVVHTDLGTPQGIKCLYVTQSQLRAFAVTASAVYEVYSSGGFAKLGDVVMSGPKVVMADNGASVVMVDGIKGYSIDLATSTVAEIVNEAFYPASSVCEQDGFLIFERKGTAQFFKTGLYNLEFDALDYATAGGKSDTVQRIISLQRQLYIFKTDSIEFWYNAGNADFPFQRSQGAFIDHGAFRYTVSTIANTAYYVGSDRTVYALLGYSPAPISTPAVTKDLKSVDLADAIGMTYSVEDHWFYVLTIPKLKKTWVYDITMQNWFVRHSSVHGRHVMNDVIRFNNKNLIADFQAGMVYELTFAAGNDNGDQLERKFILPTINYGRMFRVLHSFELDMKVGIGKPYGLDADPQGVIRISKDNGKTWGNQHQTTLGKLGEYGTRVIWRRLGSSRQFTVEVSMSANIPDIHIGGAWIGLG